MKRLDDGKVSLVEFLGSIQFTRQNTSNDTVICPTHFAHFEQQARSAGQLCAEESQLIRSAN